MRSTIICVDDEKILLNILAEQLDNWFGNNYTIEKALGGDDALEILDDCIAQNIDVSVVISDYIMPKMKGDELLEKVKNRDASIKKIMLTGYSAIDGIVSAINRAGLYRYITKPWDNKDLMLTIIEAIKSYENEQNNTQMAKKFEMLYHTFQKSSTELEATLDTVIEAISYGAETRDSSIMGHSRRVKKNCMLMAEKLNLRKEDAKSLEYAAFLHDIGKISFRDDELDEMSKNALNPNIESIRQQTEKSERIISRIKDSAKIIPAVKYHYENFDGTGLFALAGDKIPLLAQVINIANYFDLIKNNINNENVISADEAIKIMVSHKGTKFNPELVDMFIATAKELNQTGS